MEAKNVFEKLKEAKDPQQVVASYYDLSDIGPFGKFTSVNAVQKISNTEFLVAGQGYTSDAPTPRPFAVKITTDGLWTKYDNIGPDNQPGAATAIRLFQGAVYIAGNIGINFKTQPFIWNSQSKIITYLDLHGEPGGFVNQLSEVKNGSLVAGGHLINQGSSPIGAIWAIDNEYNVLTFMDVYTSIQDVGSFVGSKVPLMAGYSTISGGRFPTVWMYDYDVTKKYKSYYVKSGDYNNGELTRFPADQPSKYVGYVLDANGNQLPEGWHFDVQDPSSSLGMKLYNNFPDIKGKITELAFWEPNYIFFIAKEGINTHVLVTDQYNNLVCGGLLFDYLNGNIPNVPKIVENLPKVDPFFTVRHTSDDMTALVGDTWLIINLPGVIHLPG